MSYLPAAEFTFRTTARPSSAPASYIEPYPRQPVGNRSEICDARLAPQPDAGSRGNARNAGGEGFGGPGALATESGRLSRAAALAARIRHRKAHR